MHIPVHGLAPHSPAQTPRPGNAVSTHLLLSLQRFPRFIETQHKASVLTIGCFAPTDISN